MLPPPIWKPGYQVQLEMTETDFLCQAPPMQEMVTAQLVAATAGGLQR